MNWSTYQENTFRTKPNYLSVFLANKLEFKTLVDLGCGSGNDTVYMLKKGKIVTAIDGSLNEKYITSRINDEEKKRLSLIKSDFESVSIPKTDAILALFALPFCKPSEFSNLWNKLDKSLDIGGILVANLFGERDWHLNDDRVTNHTKEEVLALLKNYEILKWKEQEYTKDIDNTHWHYYDFVAKKIK